MLKPFTAPYSYHQDEKGSFVPCLEGHPFEGENNTIISFEQESQAIEFLKAHGAVEMTWTMEQIQAAFKVMMDAHLRDQHGRSQEETEI